MMEINTGMSLASLKVLGGWQRRSGFQEMPNFASRNQSG